MQEHNASLRNRLKERLAVQDTNARWQAVEPGCVGERNILHVLIREDQ